MLTRVSVFFSEVVAELKKVAWPERREIIESTWIVIVMVAAFTAFVGVCDITLAKLLNIVLK